MTALARRFCLAYYCHWPTNGTSYTFNVWAINPFGWSSPSDASGSVSPTLAVAAFMGGIPQETA